MDVSLDYRTRYRLMLDNSIDPAKFVEDVKSKDDVKKLLLLKLQAKESSEKEAEVKRKKDLARLYQKKDRIQSSDNLMALKRTEEHSIKFLSKQIKKAERDLMKPLAVRTSKETPDSNTPVLKRAKEKKTSIVAEKTDSKSDLSPIKRVESLRNEVREKHSPSPSLEQIEKTEDQQTSSSNPVFKPKKAASPKMFVASLSASKTAIEPPMGIKFEELVEVFDNSTPLKNQERIQDGKLVENLNVSSSRLELQNGLRYYQDTARSVGKTGVKQESGTNSSVSNRKPPLPFAEESKKKNKAAQNNSEANVTNVLKDGNLVEKDEKAAVENVPNKTVKRSKVRKPSIPIERSESSNSKTRFKPKVDESSASNLDTKIKSKEIETSDPPRIDLKRGVKSRAIDNQTQSGLKNKREGNPIQKDNVSPLKNTTSQKSKVATVNSEVAAKEENTGDKTTPKKTAGYSGFVDRIKKFVGSERALEEEIDETSDSEEQTVRYNVISGVRPVNVESEKCKFFKLKFDYNPIFKYYNPLPPEVLHKYSYASDVYLPQSVKIMKFLIRKYGSYENFEATTGGRQLTRQEIIDLVKDYCRRENFKDGEIVLNLSEDLLSTASMSRTAGPHGILSVRIGDIHESWIEGLLRHELSTHYVRSCNNMVQPWAKSKDRKKFKLYPANPTEEGLASLHTVLLRQDPLLFRNALLYFSIAMAAKLTFRDLFLKLGEYVHDPHRRWDYCMRAKRGQTDTSRPGCFAKDQVYLTGALNILKNRKSIDFEALMRLGKVSFEDVERLKKAGNGDLKHDSLRVPSFMSNMKFYRGRLDAIMKANGLSDSDFKAASKVTQADECRFDI